MEIEEDANQQNQPKRTKTTHETTTNLAENTEQSANFPPEIILEILSRLPVKSLLRFRSVCKSWQLLISSPHFVETHLNVSTNYRDFLRHRLISSFIRPHFSLRSCSLYSVLYEPTARAVDLDYPMKNPHSSVWIVGSCNGLICLAIEEDSLFFWNPSIRKSKKLPNSGVKLRYGCYVIYGFGYDEANDDYKVVRIYCAFGNGGFYETEVSVYSSRTNSWRRIQGFPHGVPLDDSGKFANGALHWASSRSFGSKYQWEIVSFDLAKEMYEVVGQPNYGDGDFDLSLGVLGRCLCVVCNYYGAGADVWVMKKYGVRESWVKLFTVPYFMDVGNFGYSIPLSILKDGKILLELLSHLVVYDSKDGTFEQPEIHNFHRSLLVDVFVESLVFPDAE